MIRASCHIICLQTAFALSFGTLNHAAADSPFAKYAGAWDGIGTIAATAEGPLRKGKCRVDVISPSSSNNSDELRIEGVCAIAVGRTKFILRAIRTEGNHVKAGFRAKGMKDTIQFHGAFSGGQIKLDSSSAVVFDGQRYLSHLVLSFSGDNTFILDEWLKPVNGNVSRHAVSLDFERRIQQD